MAIIKTHTDKFGFAGEYWRIVHHQYDHTSSNCSVIVFFYKDKESRIKGFTHMLEKQFDISVDSSTLTRKDLYTILKADTFFACSSDDM